MCVGEARQKGTRESYRNTNTSHMYKLFMRSVQKLPHEATWFILMAYLELGRGVVEVDQVDTSATKGQAQLRKSYGSTIINTYIPT